MAWHKVATLADIADDEPLGVMVGEHNIALYKVEGEVFATSNICTHAFALMSDGYLEGDRIECPLHQGIFCVRDGKALEGPVDEDLQTFKVKVEDDDVFVEA